MRTSIVMYLESFCQTLDAEEHEEDLSFLDMLNQTDIDEPQPDILNLDSNQIETMDQHVWDRDVSEWLDDLIVELNEQSQFDFVEDNFDNFAEDNFEFENFVEDMTPDDWENVWNDVINNFDSNLL